MAGEIPDLIAEVRTGTGKGAARQARREQKVPGIVYGGGADPLPLNFDFNYLLKHLKAGRFLSTLWNLRVEGQDDVRVIARAVQRDVVKGLPTHVDLMRLRRTTRISLFINVEFINHDKCPGLKRGGTLTIVRPEVELSVIAADIPEKVTVDLEGLAIGETITISSVPLPDGVKPTIERDFVIANIVAPRAVTADADEDAAEAGAEPSHA
ncbi:MAG: 50S ribosomal protein L25/general stress protein Ctc [Rhodobacteraceae bacterium]|nr:50S ribosomal protein L25/general stress protein Ctc [Paracoccaceae bacterium]